MADASPARRLVLLRHGRTAWNAERRAQGHSDVELDDTGHAQAAAVAPYLAGLAPVAAVVLRPGPRPADGGVRRQGGAASSLRSTPRLREYDLGERTGLTMAEYAAAHPEEYRAFRAGRYDVVPGGETRAEQVVARVTRLRRRGPGRARAGGVRRGRRTRRTRSRCRCWSCSGWPEDAAAGLQALDNCGWAESRGQRASTARLRLAAYNRHRHPISRPLTELASIPRVAGPATNLGLWRSW